MTTDNEIKKQLDHFQREFTQINGHPFKHFHCPILQVDEPVDFCLGHVVNDKIPGASQIRVIQRKDVDNWYGTHFEADLVAFHKARSAEISKILADTTIINKLNPTISVEGEPVQHHIYNGNLSPKHTQLKMQSGNDVPVTLVLKMPPQEVDALIEKRWRIDIHGDFRICNVVSMIKAAYLTLFQMLGYSYSNTAAGWNVGKHMLGKFYLENLNRTRPDIQNAAKSFFSPYFAMVRPMKIVEGIPPKGTCEDGAAMIAFGSSGRPYGLLVLVRTGKTFNAVLMPAFLHPDSVAAYVDFLKNDTETLRMNNCQFNQQNKSWDVEPDSFQVHWPKRDSSFRIE